MESVIVQVLIQSGVPGILLWWFMQRAENRMDRIERALDRQTKAQLLTIVDKPHDEQVREQARALLAEIPEPVGSR